MRIPGVMRTLCATTTAAVRLCSHSSRIPSATVILDHHHSMQPSLAICGPSGVGKTTLISNLLALHPNQLELCVSHTTRKPRPGEIDGVHYHFIEKEEMEKIIDPTMNRFVEFAHVHAHIYGTSYDAVRAIQRKGKLCVLDIDIDGVRQLKAKDFPAQYLFIAPPSFEVLKERLTRRKTESSEQIKIRLTNAENELKYGTKDHFDAIIVNDDLQTTVSSINSQIMAWFPHIFAGATSSS
jgi:guanylate kinase